MYYLNKPPHLRCKQPSELASSLLDEGAYQPRQPNSIRQKTDERRARCDGRNRGGERGARGKGERRRRGRDAVRNRNDEEVVVEGYPRAGGATEEEESCIEQDPEPGVSVNLTSVTERKRDHNAPRKQSAFTDKGACSEDQRLNAATRGRSKQRATKRRVKYHHEKKFRRESSNHGDRKDFAERSFARYCGFHDSSDDDDCENHQTSPSAKRSKQIKKSQAYRRNRRTINVSAETIRSLSEAGKGRSPSKQVQKKTQGNSSKNLPHGCENTQSYDRLHTFLQWASKKSRSANRSGIYVIPKRTEYSNLTTDELDYISLCVRTEEALNKPLPLASNRTVYKYWLKKYGIALTGLLLTDSSDIETTEEDEDEDESQAMEERITQCHNQRHLQDNLEITAKRNTLVKDKLIVVKQETHSTSTQTDGQDLYDRSNIKDANKLSLQNVSNISLSPRRSYPEVIKEGITLNNTSNDINLVASFLKSATTYLDNRFDSTAQRLENKATSRSYEQPSTSTDGEPNNDHLINCSKETQTIGLMQEGRHLETCNKETNSLSCTSNNDYDENKTVKLAFLIADNLFQRQVSGQMAVPNKMEINPTKKNITKTFSKEVGRKLYQQQIYCSSESVAEDFGEEHFRTPRPPCILNDPKKPVWCRRMKFIKQLKQITPVIAPHSLKTQLPSDVKSANTKPVKVIESAPECVPVKEEISNNANEASVVSEDIEEMFQTSINSTQKSINEATSPDVVTNIPKINGDEGKTTVKPSNSAEQLVAGLTESRTSTSHCATYIPSEVQNTKHISPVVEAMDTVPKDSPGAESPEDNFQPQLMEEIESKPRRLIVTLPPPVLSGKGFLGSYINQQSSKTNEVPSVSGLSRIPEVGNKAVTNAQPLCSAIGTSLPHNLSRSGQLTPIETPDVHFSPQGSVLSHVDDLALAVGSLPPRRGLFAPMSMGSLPTVTTNYTHVSTSSVDNNTAPTACTTLATSSRFGQLAPLAAPSTNGGKSKDKKIKKKKKDKKNKKKRDQSRESLSVIEEQSSPRTYQAFTSNEEMLDSSRQYSLDGRHHHLHQSPQMSSLMNSQAVGRLGITPSRPIDRQSLAALSRQTGILSSAGALPNLTNENMRDTLHGQRNNVPTGSFRQTERQEVPRGFLQPMPPSSQRLSRNDTENNSYVFPGRDPTLIRMTTGDDHDDDDDLYYQTDEDEYVDESNLHEGGLEYNMSLPHPGHPSMYIQRGAYNQMDPRVSYMQAHSPRKTGEPVLVLQDEEELGLDTVLELPQSRRQFWDRDFRR